jgi:hypothetical protein
MIGKNILVKNMWYKVLDAVIVAHNNTQCSITNYLCLDEKDNVKLIDPKDIEVIESTMAKP